MFAWLQKLLFVNSTTKNSVAALTTYEQAGQAKGWPYPLWAEPDNLSEYGLAQRRRQALLLGIPYSDLKQPTPSALEVRIQRLENAVFPLGQ